MAFPFASHGGLHARFLSLRDKICDGNHVHGESRGQALKLAESYTFGMTDARYASSRTTQALPVIHSPACCCVARSNPWPIAVNSSSIEVAQDNLRLVSFEMAAASSVEVTGTSGIKQEDVQERADHWKKLLWEAAISADSEHVGDRHEVVSFKNMLNALYDGVPPQSAASSALAETSYRHLRRLAEISDEGLKRLQPELRRGQRKGFC